MRYFEEIGKASVEHYDQTRNKKVNSEVAMFFLLCSIMESDMDFIHDSDLNGRPKIRANYN